MSPKKVPLEISSFVVKRASLYLWEFIIASKTNRQSNSIPKSITTFDNPRLTIKELISKVTFFFGGGGTSCIFKYVLMQRGSLDDSGKFRLDTINITTRILLFFLFDIKR